MAALLLKTRSLENCTKYNDALDVELICCIIIPDLRRLVAVYLEPSDPFYWFENEIFGPRYVHQTVVTEALILSADPVFSGFCDKILKARDCYDRDCGIGGMARPDKLYSYLQRMPRCNRAHCFFVARECVCDNPLLGNN